MVERIKSVQEGFDVVIDHVRSAGREVTVRGYDTIEIANFHLTIDDPTDHFVWDTDDPRRNVLESEIKTVRWGDKPEVEFPNLDDKLDLDDGTFYEDIIRERISIDWDEWLYLLKKDNHTRKACSLFGSEPDPPCTSRVQWMIRDGQLDCYTYNRSQDMMFAFPMDMGLFEEYQCKLAEQLGVPVGIHEHMMTSAHIYKKDLD